MKPEGVRAEALMGTLIRIDAIDPKAGPAVDRAFDWFRRVEAACNRFDPESEVRRLSTCGVGRAIPAGPLLFEAVRFALAVAEDTDGAFDPTVGLRMERLGFDRDYRTGSQSGGGGEQGEGVSFRDVRIDEGKRTIRLERPLLLDLGAVAKGLAIDLAARELIPYGDFAIDAGGDLYVAGRNRKGESWKVGIRHPRDPAAVLETLAISDEAVCTSGDYERPAPRPHEGHHVLDPRAGGSATGSASATVLAPTAMVADALATAAFVLGPDEGIRLLERHGVDGIIVTPELKPFTTRGFDSRRASACGRRLEPPR